MYNLNLFTVFSSPSSSNVKEVTEAISGLPLIRVPSSKSFSSAFSYPPEHHWYRYDNTLIPVYEVEWIETDKDFKMQRYQTVRIGDEIYVLKGLDEGAPRTKDDPNATTLSINGVWFNNRGGEPHSMALACMVLQDKYDLLHFYRDSLIANSGSVGDFINIPTLPTILGNSLAERLIKWKAYKKQGMALIDTSQEGQVGTG